MHERKKRETAVCLCVSENEKGVKSLFPGTEEKRLKAQPRHIHSFEQINSAPCVRIKVFYLLVKEAVIFRIEIL